MEIEKSITLVPKWLETIIGRMEELTDNQISRQEFVDNQIHELLISLNPNQTEIDWNIESIAEIREVIGHIIVNC